MVGAINLALTYCFTNPGTAVNITLADGKSLKINYNCTSVPSHNTSSLPTIWFEADEAHGVVDFLGVQTILAETHGRNSCSYDPPNFEPHTTKGLVLLDASPDGIEWFDKQRAMNWTEEEMLHYRDIDLASRVELMRMTLVLGVPWGLMPIFNPANSTGYFDSSLYPRFHAQSMKEDMWAMQYYALLQMAAGPINDYLANTTVPLGTSTYAIMTYSSGTDEASDAFYRKQKTQMANNIAGGDLTHPIVWCQTNDCSMSFPVDKPAWTAEKLISLGI
ncbi:hypothetical protein G7Z17_g4751 [Cylindrodendrum hubeiense]|uniref:Uncharacterized protein n=1 Tax=Cylindrodendrum hubeiense TaxID=595255 RepID=A0A9P5H8A5_9HYPO|nr:hypothetical protein G7Z17_g4751 [Cylindrodendrum hubeiense]